MLELKSCDGYCVSCCDKTKPAQEILINRDASAYKGRSIVSFCLCDDCLKKLSKEFSEIFCD